MMSSDGQGLMSSDGFGFGRHGATGWKDTQESKEKEYTMDKDKENCQQQQAEENNPMGAASFGIAGGLGLGLNNGASRAKMLQQQRDLQKKKRAQRMGAGMMRANTPAGLQFTRGAPIQGGLGLGGGFNSTAAPAESKNDGAAKREEAPESKNGDNRRDERSSERDDRDDRADRDRYDDRFKPRDDRHDDREDRRRREDERCRDRDDRPHQVDVRRSRDSDRGDRDYDRDYNDSRDREYQSRRQLSPSSLARRVRAGDRDDYGSDSDEGGRFEREREDRGRDRGSRRAPSSRNDRDDRDDRSESPQREKATVRENADYAEAISNAREREQGDQMAGNEESSSEEDDEHDDEHDDDEDYGTAEAKGTGASDRKRSAGAKGMGIGDEADAKEGSSVDSKLDLSDMRRFLMTPADPEQGIVQCHIKRNKAGRNSKFPEYCLYLRDGNRFLMCSKKRRHQKTANYLVSMQRGDMDRGSANTLGKLRANFLGTEFTIYDNGINPKDAFGDDDKEVREELGVVLYAKNVLGSKAPRKMKVCVPKVNADLERAVWKPMRKCDEMSSKCKDSDHTNMVVLNNKKPQWNDQVGAHVLDFGGRVTMASVKNFQLVAPEDQDTIMLQFGRVGKDEFTMDYQYPLSPFQAFAITLSSFDSKLACDS